MVKGATFILGAIVIFALIMLYNNGMERVQSQPVQSVLDTGKTIYDGGKIVVEKSKIAYDAIKESNEVDINESD